MLERRGAAAAAAVVAVLVVGAIGWALGRATAPDSTGNTTGAGSAAVKTIGGIPVGVLHTRAGAVAAADNYVALASGTVVQDPGRYEQLVRRAYAPKYQPVALREGKQQRVAAPEVAASFAQGGRAVAVIAARRLDTYDGRHANVTTWLAGAFWGPGRPTSGTWSLVETSLVWDGQRWLVARADKADRPAPAPQRVGYDDKSSFERSTFDRELRDMTAPTYGPE